jgi:hypothetical protein
MLAAAVLLGACGADEPSVTDAPAETVPAERYVTDLCGSITTWQDDIGTLTEELQSQTNEPASLDVVKETTVAYFDDAITATDALLTDVEGAGVPDVADGEETARRVTTAIDDIRDAMTEGRDRIEGLSTEDPQAFASELRTITNDVGTDLEDVSSELESFQAPELDEIAEDVPACEGL